MSLRSSAEDTDPLLPTTTTTSTSDAGEREHPDQQSEQQEEHSAEAEEDSFNRIIAKVQYTALVVAHILSVTCILVVIWWISLLGGLNRKIQHVFNWHPFLMITAFCFMTVAALSFRYNNRNRQHNNTNNANHHRRLLFKWIHGMAWFVAAMCAIVALMAVFQSHNNAAVSGKFIANLYSLHSWIGIAVILMYTTQFIMGIFTFTFAWPSTRTNVVMSLSSQNNKKACIMRIHKFLGPFIYNCTAVTILLGIQEKEGFIGCSYAVSSADVFPPQHFLDIPYSCRVSHLLGVLVLTVAFCTNLALQEFQQGGRVVDDSSSQRHEL